MKSTTLTIIILAFSFSVHSRTITGLTKSIIFKPVKVFIPIKKGYRQLRISTLPTLGNKINAKQLIITSSSIDKRIILSLSSYQKKLLKKIIVNLKKNNQSAAKKNWRSLISKFNNQTTPVNINELINYVLNKSFLESRKSLKYFAIKMKHIQDTGTQLRIHLKDLRTIRKSNSIPHKIINDLDNTISNAEDKLATIGDDAQLTDIDLQNMLRKQQQLIRTIAKISKTLHDMALAIIRKIG